MSSKKGGRRSGRRCVVGGCSNTSFDDYAIYTIAVVKDEAIRRKWIQFVSGTRTNFDEKNAKTVYVCDGHFEEHCFNHSQKAQYMSNIRSKAPELAKDAAPSIKTATRPHFVKPTTYENNQAAQALAWRNAVVEDPPLEYIPPIMVSPVQAEIEGTTYVQLKRRSSAQPSYLCQTPTSGAKARKVRRPNLLTLAKERQDIEADLAANEPQHTEDNCEIPDCSRPHSMPTQTEPFIRHQQTQYDKGLSGPKAVTTRNKKVQHKYKERHKATQTEEPLPTRCLCNCHCSSAPVLKDTQTSSVQPTQPRPPKPTPTLEADDPDADDGLDTQGPGDGSDPKDKDWMPPEDEDEPDSKSDDPDCDDDFLNETTVPSQERKYIVFESNLMELFQFCPLPKCGAPCNVKRSTARCHGSMLVILQECTVCDFNRKWTSQPMIGNLPAGNILMSAAILYAGTSPTKVLRFLTHMNIQCVTNNTFITHQRLYLQPAIVTKWREYQANIIAELKEKGKPSVLGGDGRWDSPGHSAKYGTYTLMDLEGGKIVDIQLVQTTEVKSSNHMELEGLKRCLSYIDSQGLTVGTLITDRHVQIPKFLRENYPDIIHRFDVWHIAKNVKKQLTAVGKLSGCEEIIPWQKSITNHLYWSAPSTPSADGELMAAKFHSLQNHLVNKHTGHGEHPDFDECEHGELEPRNWLKADSKAYDKVCDIITKPHLTRALKKMSPLEQTSNVEAFHGVMCMWAPKLLAFSYTGMKCRSYLAVLHWNENGNRDQASTSEGALQYSITFPKQKGGDHTVKKVLTACTYEYAGELMRQTEVIAEEGDKNLCNTLPELEPMEALCNRYEHPDKNEAVIAARSRGRFASTPAE